MIRRISPQLEGKKRQLLECVLLFRVTLLNLKLPEEDLKSGVIQLNWQAKQLSLFVKWCLLCFGLYLTPSPQPSMVVSLDLELMEHA